MLSTLLSLSAVASVATAAPSRAHSTLRRAGVLMAEKPVIVVSGVGIITSLGHGDGCWASLLEGKSGVATVSHFDASAYATKIGGEVGVWFQAGDYFDSQKSVKQNDRYTHFGLAAARMAVEHAGLDLAACDRSRVGVMVGSAFGGMGTFEDEVNKLTAKGPKRVSPFTIPGLLGNTVSGVIGIELGCEGPNFGVVSACAAGSHAIGQALRALQYGEADVILCGGAEAAITPLSYAGFCAMKAMAADRNDDPASASRPFDAARSGFVMGEGSGVIVLETLEHALKRGAADKVLCELAGYAATCDAHHITTPHPEGQGLFRCLQQALADAKVDPADVGYVNAHGTSTAYNDRFETMAYKRVWGPAASELLISSTKSMIGHTLGAAGGIEAAICALALKTGDIPPTINYETLDADCDLNYCANVAHKLPTGKRVAVSDNLGFGGHNAALVFRQIDAMA
ncbi:3-oxoacyl-synthase 2 [Pavlovales sp. CCMP2436]|nr:3-oxoacyl-synthase 2 [Pavlovales sp. CCMP2436]